MSKRKNCDSPLLLDAKRFTVPPPPLPSTAAPPPGYSIPYSTHTGSWQVPWQQQQVDMSQVASYPQTYQYTPVDYNNTYGYSHTGHTGSNHTNQGVSGPHGQYRGGGGGGAWPGAGRGFNREHFGEQQRGRGQNRFNWNARGAGGGNRGGGPNRFNGNGPGQSRKSTSSPSESFSSGMSTTNHAFLTSGHGTDDNLSIDGDDKPSSKNKPSVNKKAKRKSMSTKFSTKAWDRDSAKRALATEMEFSRLQKTQSLILKFPDPELNKEIVKSFNTNIEHVHFQQPSTARYCFVQLHEGADIDEVQKELEQIQFGHGKVSVERKKERDEETEVGPEEIDPFTLYIGNLPTSISVGSVKEKFPTALRIDIGFAQRMKYTRYAFIRYNTVEEAISAYKKTHNLVIESRSIIVRFRRQKGNVGLPGESKPHAPPPPAMIGAQLEPVESTEPLERDEPIQRVQHVDRVELPEQVEPVKAVERLSQVNNGNQNEIIKVPAPIIIKTETNIENENHDDMCRTCKNVEKDILDVSKIKQECSDCEEENGANSEDIHKNGSKLIKLEVKKEPVEDDGRIKSQDEYADDENDLLLDDEENDMFMIDIPNEDDEDDDEEEEEVPGDDDEEDDFIPMGSDEEDEDWLKKLSQPTSDSNQRKLPNSSRPNKLLSSGENFDDLLRMAEDELDDLF